MAARPPRDENRPVGRAARGIGVNEGDPLASRVCTAATDALDSRRVAFRWTVAALVGRRRAEASRPTIGLSLQGYAIWAALSRSLIWPIMWPSGGILYATILLIYYLGFCMQNATLAAELIRKTQLESEQFAAQKIQKTLQPTTIDDIPGYEIDAFYKPLRAVGGDYFDVVDLPGHRTLFVVVADQPASVPVHARQPICHRSLHRARQGFG